ncbi:MAG: OmpA family protein [Zoogloeaceae bacterium]|nr:OmpA family protein [Zoogloeaceae bacterium]
MRGLLLALSLIVTGCAGVSERIILLPAADGHISGLVVRTGRDEALLVTPLSAVEVRDGRIVARTLAAGEVNEKYGSVIRSLPPAPKVYTVFFHFDRTTLLPESRALLDEIKARAEKQLASEIVITGHTDRVGSIPFNDELSLRRAHMVREIFLAIGVPPSAIRLEARGEREPLIPTEDEVPEARNRRVVIKIR